MQEKKQKVDVIIPTYKPDEKLTQLIQRLNMQTYEVNKIIIINTKYKNYDVKKYTRFEKVELHEIQSSQFDHGTTRNYGITFSDADIVVFMTQDAVPADKNLIKELVIPFSDEDVLITYARQIPTDDCKLYEAFTRQFNYPDYDVVKTKKDIENLGIKTYFSSDVCAAYRREKQIRLGGFPKTLFSEDSIFASKVINIGKKVYYASKAVVIHSHNYTWRQQFHRNFDIGVSHRKFNDNFGNVKSENEGIRLVKQTAKYLVQKNKAYLIPDMLVKSGIKYLGYRLGKAYNSLPKSLILKCTMNKGYWK